MNSALSNLQKIKFQINETASQCGRDPSKINLLAATKSQSFNNIESLILEGQRLFGENKIQEALSKWPRLKKIYSDIELHLIGHLQTNKVTEAIFLFDVIQTLDSLKLAERLAKEEERQRKNLKYYIEINIGKESQKTGIYPESFGSFISELKNNFTLNIQGIMCIPPQKYNPVPFFEQMQKIAMDHQLPIISMGMSEDFKLAIQHGTTMIRIGRALFQ